MSRKRKGETLTVAGRASPVERWPSGEGRCSAGNHAASPERGIVRRDSRSLRTGPDGCHSPASRRETVACSIPR